MIQVPDFGDRFWVYAFYDHAPTSSGSLGKPYATQPGFYLLAGPNWRGQVPPEYEVVRSSTAIANSVPRVFLDDTAADRAAVRSLVDQVVVYPLSEFDGSIKTTD